MALEQDTSDSPQHSAAEDSLAKPQARTEWRNNWLVVLSSTIGMSLPTIGLYSLGLFFLPLEQEYGWSRAQISFGLTIYALINAPLAPFAGALMDRWGARRVAIPGVIMYGVFFSSLSLAGPSDYSWWLVWGLIAIAVLFIKPTVWLIAISSRFVTARGIAMSIALSGTAIASFLSPILARWLIAEFGWRMAYVCMGVGWGGITLLLAFFFFYDARDAQRVALKTGKALAKTATIILPGKTLREAIRDPAFLRVCGASLLIQMVIVGTTVHFVPMLTLHGLSREAAAGLAGAVGLSAAIGKMATGWLYDRLRTVPIAAGSLALPAVPFLILALMPYDQPSVFFIALPTAVLLGLATGAELSTTAYVATQYVGLRAFGKNYGIISAIMAISAGFGPLLAAAVYDKTGGYSALMFWGIAAALIAGALLATLPKPPDWSASENTQQAS